MQLDVRTWNSLPVTMRKTLSDGTRMAMIEGQWKPVTVVQSVKPPVRR